MFSEFNSMIKKSFLTLVVGLIALFLVACGGGVTGDSDNFISVNDQAVVELDKINIVRASLNTNAWIIIYDEDKLLQRQGSVIATHLLEAGEHENEVVVLNRDATHGETLYAGLRKDNGEPGVYEQNVDGVIAQSATTAASFVVNFSATPYLIANDQEISSVATSSIQVEKVISDKAAVLVVYRFAENAENQFGELIGFQPVHHETESTLPIHLAKVQIGLAAQVVEGEKLVIALYYDQSLNDDGLSTENNGKVVVTQISILPAVVE